MDPTTAHGTRGTTSGFAVGLLRGFNGDMADGDSEGNAEPNPDESADAFAGMFDDDGANQGARFVPDGCDLFAETYTDAKHAELVAAKRDPVGCRVRIKRHIDGKRVQLPGMWPAEQTNSHWLLQTFGPGIYEAQLTDRNNRYVMQERNAVEGAQYPGSSAIPQQMAHGYGPPGMMPPPYFPPAGYPYAPPAPAPAPVPVDPMREVMAGMVKMMQAQMTLDTMRMNRQASIDAPAVKNDDRQHELMMLLVKSSLEQKNGRANGKQNGETGQMEGLKMGLTLGQLLVATQNGKQDEDWLKELLPSAVEHLGPGVIATIAHAVLPNEKAEAIVSIVEQQVKASQERNAEAAEKKSVIDTDGQPA